MSLAEQFTIHFEQPSIERLGHIESAAIIFGVGKSSQRFGECRRRWVVRIQVDRFLQERGRLRIVASLRRHFTSASERVTP